MSAESATAVRVLERVLVAIFFDIRLGYTVLCCRTPSARVASVSSAVEISGKDILLYKNRNSVVQSIYSENIIMGNGMNKILPGVYVGNFRDAKDVQQLKENNITHIISLHDNAKPIMEGMIYKCLEVSDCPEQNLSKHFHECIEFIHKCRVEGGAVLVHCIAGVSRSTTIVAAYIMAVTNLTWRESIFAIRHSRSIANPNHGFQRQLLEFGNLEIPKVKSLLRKYPKSDFEQDQTYVNNLFKKQKRKKLVILMKMLILCSFQLNII